MSDAKLKKYMRRLIWQRDKNGDTEDAHSNADDILCEILVELGYGALVEVYKKVPKWYS